MVVKKYASQNTPCGAGITILADRFATWCAASQLRKVKNNHESFLIVIDLILIGIGIVSGTGSRWEFYF